MSVRVTGDGARVFGGGHPMAASRLWSACRRPGVVHADGSLRERELRKQSVLSEAMRLGFLERGADELTSTLAAEIAVNVFSVGLSRWLDQDGGPPLSALRHETLDALMRFGL